MCSGIAISGPDLPVSLIEQHALQNREVVRQEGAEREFRFLYRDPYPLLPAWRGEQLCIFTWGNRSRRSRLPRTGCVRLEDLEAGYWNPLHPEEVDIPASFGLDKGVWFQVREGIRGVLVLDEQDHPNVYMVTEPASHYYQVMTRHDRMPVFIGSRI
jgi:hypothetical protein